MDPHNRSPRHRRYERQPATQHRSAIFTGCEKDAYLKRSAALTLAVENLPFGGYMPENECLIESGRSPAVPTMMHSRL